MKVICPTCREEYDDLYYNTVCPHEYFEMHTGVFVNGKQGCAHTVEELSSAVNENILPNPDCEYRLALQNLQEALDKMKDCD